MITVIIAGGSGTRLWPLSTPTYPKQLLKINGDDKSLLQRTYERAKQLSDTVYVIPEVSLAHHVKEQLSELPEDAFITEPGRRGTANCIVAALTHIAARHEPDEPIAFIASDHYVRDNEGFVHSFKVAAEASTKSNRIVLVGVEPDHAATGFGYIQKGDIFDSEAFVFNVHSFKEKPDFNVAKQFVKSGNYLWNCSYFIGSVDTFKKNMKEYAPDLYKNFEALSAAKDPKTYKETYLSFESDAIDYALLEHIVDDLLVVPAAFDWMDLGSFGDLHKAVDSDEQGNHVFGENVEVEDAENSFVQNYEDKPVAVIGVDNVVVINTKDGILVARKDLSKKIGEVSKRISAKIEEKK
jgi:mannose-1-phosphate guanylyltransferase